MPLDAGPEVHQCRAMQNIKSVILFPFVVVLWALCAIAALVGAAWFGGVEAMRKAGDH